MAGSRFGFVIGSVLFLVSTSAFAPDFSVLLGGTGRLQSQLEAEAARSARSAQAFGASLTAMDRRDLQGTCSALVANPGDTQAQAKLQSFLSRYKDNTPEAVLRFCLDPAIARLNGELQASRQSLERMTAARAADDGRNAALETTLQQQQRTFTTISNVMKTKHDTAKNAISNVR
jgi:hypothetical protein